MRNLAAVIGGIARPTLVAGGCLVAAASLLVAGCGIQAAPRGGYAGPDQEALNRSVEYRVRCGDCAVSYRLPRGMEGRVVRGSWSHTLGVPSGELLSLTAESRDGGFAEVVIRVEGSEVARDRIEGGASGRSASVTHMVR